MELLPSHAEANAVITELRVFEKGRRNSPELVALYGNPAVEISVKVDATKAIAEKLQVRAIGIRLLEVLVRNHRINDLGGVLAGWKDLLNAAGGVSRASVRSAYALNDEETRRLSAALERRFGGTIEMELSTDPSLLGGFVAQVGSEIHDASILGQITKFRTSLV
jgi:F-type H+-transporting ATPase subunit delta